MTEIHNNDITVTRGDSLLFTVRLRGQGLTEGAAALFTVKEKPSSEEAVIGKTFPVGGEGTVTIYLYPEETNLKAKTYYWDLRLIIPHGDEANEVRTPMEYAGFTVLEAIGDA